ncbi:unnamed protein product [marine sediment metagenome]|uniref:Uncharacterized protein n=1 Tax=marine sediment metagenome TaxID=412755 RepID=X1C627_9ZZZZ
MPVMFFLKNPPISLATLGKLDGNTVKKLLKSTPMIQTQAPDGLPMLICVNQNINISYIKEITEESLEKMREEQKEQAKESRIQKPKMGFPGRGGGEGLKIA